MKYSEHKEKVKKKSDDDMKRLLVILGIVWGFWGSAGSAEIVDQIVAILDEDLILRSEVRECAAQAVVQACANLEANGGLEQAALRYLIERRLLLREIQYLAVPKEAEPVQTLAVQYLIDTYYRQDAQAFTAKVQALGLTEAALLPELTLYLKGLDYIRRKHRFNEEIDDPNVVLQLFRKWLADLHTQAKIRTLF